MKNQHELLPEYWMREAFKQAKDAFDEDEVPVGAVIVSENKLIARAHNQVERLKDPTAHAEMIAITQAANTLGRKWLKDCSMYVTVEPCSMCAGALVLSRIKHLFIGADDPKTGGCGSVFNIAANGRLNHSIAVHKGVLAQECGQLMSMFFQRKRKKEIERWN